MYHSMKIIAYIYEVREPQKVSDHNVQMCQSQCVEVRWYYWADSRFAPIQWETALLCNDVSHWLGANLEPILYYEPVPLMFHHIKALLNTQTHIKICKPRNTPGAYTSTTPVFEERETVQLMPIWKWNRTSCVQMMIRNRLAANDDRAGIMTTFSFQNASTPNKIYWSNRIPWFMECVLWLQWVV